MLDGIVDDQLYFGLGPSASVKFGLANAVVVYVPTVGSCNILVGFQRWILVYSDCEVLCVVVKGD